MNGVQADNTAMVWPWATKTHDAGPESGGGGGGNGIKKRGGGNDASLHSAMFDSARVRGVLRCYDTIDRVVRRLSLSLRCLLPNEGKTTSKKRPSFSVPLFFFLTSLEFTNCLRKKKRAELNQTALSVDEFLLLASGRPRGGGRHQRPVFFHMTLPQTTSQRPPEVRSWHAHCIRAVISTFRPISVRYQ